MQKIKAIIDKHGATFLKYAVVGTTGTIIDIAGFTVLAQYTSLGDTTLTRGVAALIAFIAAVINNYTWNRLWTFKSHEEKIGNQFSKFLLVSSIGYLLNFSFLTLFSNSLVSFLAISSVKDLPVLGNIFAKGGASAIVLIYNFIANRFWTFKED